MSKSNRKTQESHPWSRFLGSQAVTTARNVVVTVSALAVVFSPHQSARGETNSVWNASIPSLSLRDVVVGDFVDWLERASRDADPDRRGISVVYPSVLGSMGINVDVKNISFRQALQIVPAKVTFVGKHAVMFYKPEGAAVRVAGVYGRCIDARTRRPINRISLRQVPEFTPSLRFTVATDGSFTAAVPYNITGAFLDDSTRIELREPEATFEVTAPRYRARIVTIPVGDFHINDGHLPLEIVLEPEGSKGE